MSEDLLKEVNKDMIEIERKEVDVLREELRESKDAYTRASCCVVEERLDNERLREQVKDLEFCNGELSDTLRGVRAAEKIQMGESANRHDWIEVVDGKAYLVRKECEVCGFMYPLNIKTCTACARRKYLEKKQ